MRKGLLSLAPQNRWVRFESETKKGRKPRERRETEGKIHLYHETYEMDISTNKVASYLFSVSIVFIQIVQKEILRVSLESLCLREESHLIARLQAIEG